MSNCPRWSRRALLASVLAAAPLTSLSLAADVSSSWVGPSLGVGSWSDPSNWSPSTNFPNNGNGGLTYDATIANGGTALLTQNIDVQKLDLNNSFIDGSFNLTVHDSMTWAAGGMRGSGTTTIPVGATLTMAGSFSRRSLTRTLDNFGTTIWAEGGLTGDRFSALGLFVNEPGANFIATDSFTSSTAFGIGSFINAGNMTKTAGVESRFGGIMAFSNTGTVSVKTGLIRFAGTMSQMNAGLLTGGAWVVDSTAADGGVATLQFDRDQITGIGTGARVELIGAGSDFEAITGLAGNQGTFRFSSGRTFSTVAGYNNSGTTIVGTGGSALEVNGDLQNTGTIDVNGGMIVRYTSTSPLPMIRAQIVAARNGGNWDMPGITSSAARAAANHNTTLGVMEGTDFQSIYGAAAPFFGFASSDTSVLVKYTYYGDADFNGRVNFDDYVRTDNGFNNHLSGWINGDFDLNNQVNFDDYVLIDLAFNTQSGTLGRAVSLLEGSNVGNVIDPALSEVRQHLLEFGDAYRDAFLAAVPEPAEPIVAAMIGASLFRRRRRLNRPCGAAR